ncbi:MAG: CotY/CotZ family spore coat protein [Bacilli bacterium]|jgi:hypothetical protein|nr:CotY/CotZ family spore coat protein [Bacilli bacterium]
MCNNNEDCKCIGDILRIIYLAQKNAKKHDELDTCDRKFLGGLGCRVECNTRPVQLFLKCNNGNQPLQMSTTKEPINETTCFSNVFRIEKIEDCCATFRVLEKEEACPRGPITFAATDSFFTIDLRCVCIIKCLEDTFVDCV